MTSRSVLAAIVVSLAIATAAPAGEFDDEEDMVSRTSLFSGRVNETPEQVEAVARELSMRQHAAEYTETDHGELGRLKRKSEELELRYRIAALRTERAYVKKGGRKGQYEDLEQAIHVEKQKLARMLKRHREEALAEKKRERLEMDEPPSLDPKPKRHEVPEDRLAWPAERDTGRRDTARRL